MRKIYISIDVDTQEEAEKFAEFKRVAYANKQNPASILISLAENYIKKYNPHQHVIINRKQLFALAASLNTEFKVSDLNNYISSKHLIEGRHYVLQWVNKRHRIVYVEKEMKIFFKWLKHIRLERMMSKRDRNRDERERLKELGEKPKRKRYLSIITKPYKRSEQHVSDNRPPLPITRKEPSKQPETAKKADIKTNTNIQVMRREDYE